ncbi:DUF3182 family protein [Croceibacterium ferulae]|uniref:DUF3182 family protein n=1 Tax=Croceibacterium ferulae TaxID=1854641 RepID=UPI000EAFBCD3|nr:DUF3182 family protein [Croceibacterium ferulae]
MTHDPLFQFVPSPASLPASAKAALNPMIGVATHLPGPANMHDRATMDVLAARIAALLGLPHVGECGAESGDGSALFVLPSETLDAAEAAVLGLAGADSFFGGVVPHPFVGTKAITHGLVAADAARPCGWSVTMADAVAPAVLPGFTAFSRSDAAIAGERLLARGPVRVKPVRGKAGLGQTVVHDTAALTELLAEQDDGELRAYGLCLEENLTDVVTYSVGAATVGSHRIAYWGTQSLTANALGEEVYGGSELVVVRGDMPGLLDVAPDPLIRHIVGQAIMFDQAAHRVYPDIRLSRRNYDVIQGADNTSAIQVAVLEQSWRAGGASGAEIAAMEAFAADPTLTRVTTATVEVHGRATPPDRATVYYDGVDPVVGPLTKWAQRL